MERLIFFWLTDPMPVGIIKCRINMLSNKMIQPTCCVDKTLMLIIKIIILFIKKD